MYEIPQGQSCRADINRDGLVNQEDLYELAALWLWSADENQIE
jgi:hypothetical protein